MRPRVCRFSVLAIKRFYCVAVEPFAAFFLGLRDVGFPINRVVRANFDASVVLRERNVGASQDLHFTGVGPANDVHANYPGVLGYPTTVIYGPRAPVLIIPDRVLANFRSQEEQKAGPALTPTMEQLSKDVQDEFTRNAIPACGLRVVRMQTLAHRPFATSDAMVVHANVGACTVRRIITAFKEFGRERERTRAARYELTFLRRGLDPGEVRPGRLDAKERLRHSHRTVPALKRVSIFVRESDFLGGFHVVDLTVAFYPWISSVSPYLRYQGGQGILTGYGQRFYRQLCFACFPREEDVVRVLVRRAMDGLLSSMRFYFSNGFLSALDVTRRCKGVPTVRVRRVRLQGDVSLCTCPSANFQGVLPRQVLRVGTIYRVLYRFGNGKHVLRVRVSSNGPRLF